MTETTQITSLSQLGSQNVDVRIQLDEETEILIPIRTLTYGEWQKLGREIPDPIPPISHATAQGPVYNRQDPGYLQQVQETNDRRLMRRLLAALQIEGIEGDTMDEQIDCLMDTLDTQVVFALTNALMQTHGLRSARVENRAESFRNGRHRGAKNLSKAPVDAE